MMRAVVLALAFACAFVSTRALAHQSGLSQGRYELDGATLVAHLVFSNAELANGAVLPRDIASRVGVSGDGAACAVAFEAATATEQDGVDIALRATCAARPTKLALHFGFLDLLAAGHRHIASVVTAKDRVHEALAVAGSMDLAIDVGAAPASSFGALLLLGIEHILTGWDHLVFLFGLVVLGGRARSLVLALTAFTVAHSISLALAVLGVWAPRASIVEPAIALSIAYVGVENLVRARSAASADAGEDAARGRWRITLPFGLVHGFGFAGALAQIGLPRAQVPSALLAFNLGVEIGQLGVLAIALPLLAWARRWPPVRARGTKLASAAVVAAGVVWFVARVGA
jgi:hypothetical protein